MSHSRSISGFTLAEVLIALAVVSVLVAGVGGLLIVAGTSIRAAGSGTTAMLLAVQKVEQLHSSPSGGSTGTWEDLLDANGSPASAQAAAFVRRWTVTHPWPGAVEASLVVEVFNGVGGRIAVLQAFTGSQTSSSYRSWP